MNPRSPRLAPPIQDWHENRIMVGVLVAIPKHQGRISPLFDVASSMVVIQTEEGLELERREVPLWMSSDGDLAERMEEFGIDLLICGGISRDLQTALEKRGIEVWPQVCGDIEFILRAYRTGKLRKARFVRPQGSKLYGRRTRSTGNKKTV